MLSTKPKVDLQQKLLRHIQLSNYILSVEMWAVPAARKARVPYE